MISQGEALMGEYKGMAAKGEGIICQRGRVLTEYWAIVSQYWPIIAQGAATPSKGEEMTVLGGS
jgi:hypothetical protein